MERVFSYREKAIEEKYSLPSKTHDARFEKAVLIVLFLSLMLNSYRIGLALVSQYLLVISCFLWTMITKMRLSYWSWMALAIVNTYCMFGLLSNSGAPWLQASEALTGMLNLNFTLLGFLILVNMRHDNGSFTLRLTRISFYLLVFVETIQIIAIRLRIPMPIPFRQFWIGNDLLLRLELSALNRPIGLFGEPSWLAIMLFSLFFLIIISGRATFLDYFLFFVASVFTLSLTALIGVSFATALGFLHWSRVATLKWNRILLFIILISTVLLSIAFGLSSVPEFRSLSERIERVARGEDSSTNIRYAQSAMVFRESLRVSPLFGGGVGNTKSYTDYLGFQFLGEGREMNNFPHALAVIFGLPSFLLFLAFIFLSTKWKDMRYSVKDLGVISVYIVFHSLVSGLFVSSVFWIPLGLAFIVLSDARDHGR